MEPDKNINPTPPAENPLSTPPTKPVLPSPSQETTPAPSWKPQSITNGQAAPQPQPDSLNPPALGSIVQPPLKKSRKKLYIALASVLVIIGLSLGTVFGYYIPNKPENVYRTGINRSGDVIDKMINQSTEKEKLEQLKKSEMNGSLEWTSDEGNFKGSFNAKMDPAQTDGSLDVKIQETGKPEQTFSLKLLSMMQKDKRFPDTYFQLTGLKALEADQYAPGLSEYDGKWIAVEADFLESLGAGFLPPEEQKNKENISSEEVAELLRTISDVNNEYLFSTNPSKAVLENREYLGKEKTAEGINAHHYKVGVNQANSVAYCKALGDRVLSLPIAKKIANADDEDIKKYKEESNKSCDEGSKDVKQDETFEMWIDSKYKVIHKIRFYETKDKKDVYTDVGQIYTGGDKLAFFTVYHRDENNLNVKLTIDVDIKANNSKAELTAKQEKEGKFDAKATFSAKPYTGELKVEKPAGAIPIKDILARFGFDPTGQSGIQESPNSNAQKIQRCAAAYEAEAESRTPVPAECE